MPRSILFTLVSEQELHLYITRYWQGAPNEREARIEAAIDMCSPSFAMKEPLPVRNSQEDFKTIFGTDIDGFQSLFAWQRSRRLDPAFMNDCDRFQRSNPKNRIKPHSITSKLHYEYSDLIPDATNAWLLGIISNEDLLQLNYILGTLYQNRLESSPNGSSDIEDDLKFTPLLTQTQTLSDKARQHFLPLFILGGNIFINNNVIRVTEETLVTQPLLEKYAVLPKYQQTLTFLRLSKESILIYILFIISFLSLDRNKEKINTNAYVEILTDLIVVAKSCWLTSDDKKGRKVQIFFKTIESLTTNTMENIESIFELSKVFINSEFYDLAVLNKLNFVIHLLSGYSATLDIDKKNHTVHALLIPLSVYSATLHHFHLANNNHVTMSPVIGVADFDHLHHLAKKQSRIMQKNTFASSSSDKADSHYTGYEGIILHDLLFHFSLVMSYPQTIYSMYITQSSLLRALGISAKQNNPYLNCLDDFLMYPKLPLPSSTSLTQEDNYLSNFNHTSLMTWALLLAQTPNKINELAEFIEYNLYKFNDLTKDFIIAKIKTHILIPLQLYLCDIKNSHSLSNADKAKIAIVLYLVDFEFNRWSVKDTAKENFALFKYFALNYPCEFLRSIHFDITDSDPVLSIFGYQLPHSKEHRSSCSGEFEIIDLEKFFGKKENVLKECQKLTAQSSLAYLKSEAPNPIKPEVLSYRG